MFFTTFAAFALDSWTKAVWKPRGRFYFGTLRVWIFLAIAAVLKVMVFGAGVAVILAAQLVVWLLDLLTLGHFGWVINRVVMSLAGTGAGSADFNAARQQSVDRWGK